MKTTARLDQPQKPDHKATTDAATARELFRSHLEHVNHPKQPQHATDYFHLPKL